MNKSKEKEKSKKEMQKMKKIKMSAKKITEKVTDLLTTNKKSLCCRRHNFYFLYC